MEIITNSVEDTQEVAQKIAQEILEHKRPNLVLLEGELGGGKTTFSQGFIKSFGITQSVTSPTFVIMKPYNTSDNTHTIYHIDLYRLNQEWEVLDLGILDLIKNPQNILLVEWASKTPKIWEDISHTTISFKVTGTKKRTINIKD
ncbi:MAG: hypothetical protein RLZZ223_48 [Candidatus Parcubacteria bacterium]|jgi:tRNA threonylcarbamoyladenosine biosynthesis protein TsaE